MYWMIRSRLEEYWMKYNPHDYQIYAINFIKEHPIAAILLDMGMGKTSIVLAGKNMGPAKLQKAEKLGVKIINEEQFLEMIALK